MTTSEIAENLDLGIIRYSRVWEDWKLLYQGLQVTEDDVILSITSAGDNTLNLLLQRPKRLVSIDMSPAQNALLELKLSAIRQLDHDQFLELIGIKPSLRRVEMYKELQLSRYSKDYWDNNIHQLESGIVDCGKLDKSFTCYQKEHLPSCLTHEEIDSFLDSTSLQEQQENFKSLPLEKLKSLQSWYLGTMICGKGRDPSQYKYVEKTVEEIGEMMWQRFQHVCKNVPVQENIYLDLFLRSSRSSYEQQVDKLPPYLRKENYEMLKELVGRVEVVTDSLEHFLQECEPRVFSKANLSDIFEYTSEEACGKLFELLAAKCRSGGRLAYWTLFVPRSPPSRLHQKFKPHSNLSESLWEADRVFFWHGFNIDEVL